MESMKRVDTAGRDVTDLPGLQDDDTDRWIADEEYQAGCAITLTIYRDGLPEVIVTGCDTIERAAADAGEWRTALGWKIEQGGECVAVSITRRRV